MKTGCVVCVCVCEDFWEKGEGGEGEGWFACW